MLLPPTCASGKLLYEHLQCPADLSAPGVVVWSAPVAAGHVGPVPSGIISLNMSRFLRNGKETFEFPNQPGSTSVKDYVHQWKVHKIKGAYGGGINIQLPAWWDSTNEFGLWTNGFIFMHQCFIILMQVNGSLISLLLVCSAILDFLFSISRAC